MMDKESDQELEKKVLVLERLKTLNPDSKISLGGGEELSVRDLIKHVEADDELSDSATPASTKSVLVT